MRGEKKEDNQLTRIVVPKRRYMARGDFKKKSNVHARRGKKAKQGGWNQQKKSRKFPLPLKAERRFRGERQGYEAKEEKTKGEMYRGSPK